ncbi:glutamine and serine-rich protein 1 [Brienomyrus brachyistius]|uniref:glutamine and serine-rich protein 1 n=1 Tax=Brienomyrus brachyistius TaxID=42636 RepID=UPI0020B39BE3|nr:glutamine and serine-rich protein 1 [Brienomyrus brachyistius]
MMDRNYPVSSFAEPAAPTAQPAAWAYDRGTAGIKPSLNYESSHPEPELIHRQTYTSTPQIPSYAAAHHPIGLSGIFDPSLHTTGSNTTETPVMSFLSAIEPRTPQAGPATASLLPQFRAPSWQTGMNSSPATELFITGALPSSGTFPSYQHPNSFSARSFTAPSSLAIQDAAFSLPSNGLLSSHDPLLQIKSTQGAVCSTLTYDRLGATALSTSVPPQSSTYRSAQESAPHHLQPQFSVLPSAMAGPQQAPQPYSPSVFTGSVERALQRECSVIKHHQRPSSTPSVQAQLHGSSQHSLQGYLADKSDTPFQDPSRQAVVPCSPSGDSTQVSSGGLQQKTSQATLEQTQAYASSIPSPKFSPVQSAAKVSDSSSKKTPLPLEVPTSIGASPDQPLQSYPSPTQQLSPVIASQSQAYTSAQLPSLMSVSPSQSYVTSQSLPNSINHSQMYSSSQSEKLPLYKIPTTFADQSVSVSSANLVQVYSSSQPQGLAPAGHREDYGVQAQVLCSGNPSQRYPSGHSQDLPAVSYSAASQSLVTVSPSESYDSGQSSQSLTFSSSRGHNMPTLQPAQDYILAHPPTDGKTENTVSPQPQKYVTVQPPSFAPAPLSEALQNNRPSDEYKQSYNRRKVGSESFDATKQEGTEFSVPDLQSLQQTSLEASAQTLVGGDMGAQHVVYVVSKMDDRYNSPSVIRSSLRPEDQMNPALAESKKNNRMASMSHHGHHLLSATSQAELDTKKNSPQLQTSHLSMSSEEMSQRKEVQPQGQESEAVGIQHGQIHAAQPHLAQFIRLPSAQVLLEPERDLQMILLQQPNLHPGTEPSKVSNQMQQIPMQYLHMDNQIISPTSGQSQQQPTVPQNSDILKMDLSDSSKSLHQHLMLKENFSQPNQQDGKQHFALSSICFSDSMLLGDERNILSNVDDILAATAAACGVTPQDFVKATSSEGEMTSLASPTDAKGHFQLVESRHMSPSFSSQHSAISNTQTITMSQNGGHLPMGLHSLPKGGVTDHQALDLLNSHSLATSVNSMCERVVSSSQKPRSSSHGSVEDNEDVPEKHAMNHRNGIESTGKSSSDRSPVSENDIRLTSEESNQMGLVSKTKPALGKEHSQCTEMENLMMDSSADGYPKKKNKCKGSTKLPNEEENSHPKSIKRSGQGKRQNSRGSDTNSPSTSDTCYDGYQQQERMRQKIREVEEKQPEVKTGFIGSFLDFLKSGPKQQFSSPPIRMPNRSRKPSASSRRASCPLPLPPRPQPPLTPLMSLETCSSSPSKRLDDELNRNLETLPSFSSDEDDSMGRNQDLQKSINSALFSLDESADKRSKLDKLPSAAVKPEKSPSMPLTEQIAQDQLHAAASEAPVQEFLKDVPLDQLAMKLTSVAIEGLTDEELSDSGGEGMYRERDEFVVKIEDIECLKMTLKAGREPPAIWKVQKALLQKFVPELRDGSRVFSATNSYLGYFGDAKTMYRRVYVKFIDTVNKREYVRVCNRKPRCKPMHSMRGSQAKALFGHRITVGSACAASVPKAVPTRPSARPKTKQSKVKAEPPPKKRRRWKEEFSPSPSESSLEALSEDDEFTPPVPFASRFLNTRTMKETFKSFVELLISVALDPDVMDALEKESDELLLPHVKKVDGMITDNRRRLLPKLRVGQLFKSALDNFPELSLVTEAKKDEDNPPFKVRLSGKAYNRKTMRPSKAASKVPLEYTVDKEKIQWISLYHSLQHYKYHTYLLCKDEIASLQTGGQDLGQEETVQLCMRDRRWVESLFDKFGHLLTQVQQTCL